ncbi:MAG: thioredoxin [Haloarculaceae archaeon]
MSTTEHDAITHVDDETFEEAVSDGLVILDFWAEWCGPCKALEPVIEELVEEYPRLRVAKIDADDNEAAMDNFGVRSIPTMILFKHGEPVEVFAGKVPYPKLARAIEAHQW